jgi:sialate O-acetylesterase
MKYHEAYISNIVLMKTIAFVPMLASLCLTAHAAVKFPAIFSDGAVLQRDREVAVWGWADPGKSVQVTFGSQKKQTTAAADGAWMVKLDAMPASAEGREIRAAEEDGTEAVVKDVLVGEVWLASGQSNMEWNVKSSSEQDQAIANSGALPLVRMIAVPKKVTHERQEDFQGKWLPATPEHVMGFSAVGYFFARNIHEQVKVPVGIINSSWGGTRIDPWLAEEGFAEVPELADMARQRAEQLPGQPAFEQKLTGHLTATRQWCDAAEAASKAKSPVPPQPATLALLPLQSQAGMYQAMIHPVRSYGVKGFLWYQGESNNGEAMLYFQKMKVLIHGWRKQFGVPDAPFLFVQLAPYTYGSKALPEIWTAQQTTLQVPKTGMAVINDIGDVKDIHPRNKSEVGRRLALWALDQTYGIKQKAVSGPLYKAYKIDGKRIVLAFDHVGSGLATRDGAAPSLFEIAGVDGIFHPASAQVSADGKTISLTSPQVPEPFQARFAWAETAEPNLMNKEGLPAGAFHTHWPEDPTIGKNLSRGKPFASSHENKHNWNTGVTDGVYGDAAPQAYATSEAADFPKHVTVDLGTEETLALVRFGVPKVGSTKTIAISLSTDGKIFQEVGRHDFAALTSARKDLRITPQKARYVRATFAGNHEKQHDNFSRNFGFLSELEAFAPKN